MCGFLVRVSKQAHAEFDVALDSIKHRGPDGSKIINIAVKDWCVELGHVRLSVIDTSTRADQPFVSEDGLVTLVFNGEIYNFKELREEKLRNVNFRTSSDTEVLLQLYLKYPKDYLNWLEGMYSFVIIDQRKNIAFVARDELGIKPLYFYIDDSQLIFASEIRAIEKLGVKPEVSKSDIEQFLNFSFLHEPNTGFDNIKKISPGTYSKINLYNEYFTINEERFHTPSHLHYWKTSTLQRNSIINDISYSLSQHMVSDVPVAALFSGGIDSSLIVSETNPAGIFQAVSDVEKSDKLSDYQMGKKIASHLGINIDYIPVQSTENKEKLLVQMPRIIEVVEELSSDMTILSILDLSQQIAQKNYKVVLNGTGADELFWGYPKHRLFLVYILAKSFRFLLSMMSCLPEKSHKMKRLKRAIVSKTAYDFYAGLSGYFSTDEISKLLNYRSIRKPITQENIETRNIITLLSDLELRGFLSRNFILLDKGTMHYSLEGRVPLASKNLLDCTRKLSIFQHLSPWRTKKILRFMLSKKLPKQLVNRPKRAFHPKMTKAIETLNYYDLSTVDTEKKVRNYLNIEECKRLMDAGDTPLLQKQLLIMLYFWLARYA